MDSRFSLKNIFFTMMFLWIELVVGSRAQRVKVINVGTFGAIADGKTDNSQAFLKAWNQICGLEGNNILLVPKEKGAFMLRQVTFEGPCKGRIQFNMGGTIKAFTDKSAIFSERWITFQYLNNFEMTGGGRFDGQGAAAWPYNNCNEGPCPIFPTSLAFNFLNDSIIHKIRSKDSKSVHVLIFGCSNVTLQNIHLEAPKDSPNTDGIRMGDSNNIKILDSTISTGDDCVGILPGMQNTHIKGVRCGPGHGISVGSLGKSPNEKEINGLFIQNCTLKGTQNGVRIKTWESLYRSKVYNLTFQNIFMDNAQNPVIIDQHYCPGSNCPKGQASQVSIEKVTYDNVWGTSVTEMAVNLQCSGAVPCKGIILKDINMRPMDNEQLVKSSCSFVQGTSYGVQLPKACI